MPKASPRFRRLLRLETLDARDLPATLVTPGLPVGTAADADSLRVVDVSDDGNIVLFTSEATNLVPGVTDANALTDLFWRDLTNGQTLIVSATPGKVAVGFDDSVAGRAVLAGNGLKVAFVSATPATQLTGVATQSDQPDSDDVFVWTFDPTTVNNALVSATNTGDGNIQAVGNLATATDPNINDDGSKVSFLTSLSNAIVSNQTALADQSATVDIFVRTTTASNVGGAATQPVTVSASVASKMVGNLGSVFVQPGAPYMSEDGNVYVYSTQVTASAIITSAVDQPTAVGTFDIFLRDLGQGLIPGSRLLSTIAGSPLTAIGNVVGQNADVGVISADGAAVAFLSDAAGGAAPNQLVADYVPNGTATSLYVTTSLFTASPVVFLVNAKNGSTSEAGSFSDVDPGNFFLSSDGSVVAFNTTSSDLVPGLDTNTVADAYVRDFTNAEILTEVISVGDDGQTGDAASLATSIGGGGDQVVFETASTNLVVGIIDTNGVSDVFVRDRVLVNTRMASTNPANRVSGDGASAGGVIAQGGTRVAFASAATNLVSPPLSVGTSNIYFADLPLISPLSLSNVAVTSGLTDGTAQAFTFDASFNLVAAGSAFVPFDFAGDVRASADDFNGDGIEDFVYGIGPGGGSAIRLIASNGADVMLPFVYEESFTGGVFVAAGDIDGDGIGDVVVSPDQGGGGRVVVFKFVGNELVRIADFFGIDDINFRGGARVALGDVNADGILDLAVAAGFGGGPRIALFDGVGVLSTGDNPDKLIPDFFTFSPSDQFTLSNGSYVGTGDFNADGFADLVFGGGPGGGPRVFALSGADVLTNVEVAKTDPLLNFFAGDVNSRGGIRVTAKNIDGDLFADLMTGSGENEVAEVRTYLGKNFPVGGQGEPTLQQSLAPFPGLSADGVYVG